MTPTLTFVIEVPSPGGTDTTMLASLQLVGVAATVPNLTVLVPCVAPKPDPLIVTADPIVAELGVKLVIVI
jgi:hypothetical protein